MVSIMQLRSLLQLEHLMNFKRRICILEVKDRKKMLQTPCWKENDRSAACAGKIQHTKTGELKNLIHVIESTHIFDYS